MEAARIVFVGGGVRSGKSRFALARARALCARAERRVFIATAQAFDDEMRTRIDAHAAERGSEFRTLEAPLELTRTLQGIADDCDVVVIDCITLWLSNMLLASLSTQDIDARVQALVSVLVTRRFHSVIVSNEVGMGVVPESALGRVFRDVSGMAHQRLAAAADEVHFAVLGTLLRLRPAPIELATPGAFP